MKYTKTEEIILKDIIEELYRYYFNSDTISIQQVNKSMVRLEIITGLNISQEKFNRALRGE